MSAPAAGVSALSGLGAYDIPDELMVNNYGPNDTPDPQESVRYGFTPNYSRDKFSNFTISIETVIMSGLIFIAIFAWFEAIRALYDKTFDGPYSYDDDRFNIFYLRLWYAVFVTALVIILVYIIYKIANMS